MTLQTPRLILRSFRKEDVDAMAQLFANPDFMRFSLGVFTERKQTIAFIRKPWAGSRWHPVAICRSPRNDDAIIGYHGFFIIRAQHRRPRDRLSASSGLLEPQPHYRSRTRCP
jgi:RimJ/RimL family protein N-acetyltransferase